MKHPERIEGYLEHIAEAIDRIAAYIQEIDNAASFERDHKTQGAVIRYVEIIGEAANRIHKQAPEFVTAHPTLPWNEMRALPWNEMRALPWNEMRAMGNRMIHDYFDVNIDVLWSTVKADLPELKQQIDALLSR
jgi:uncharacterized protein with HEPN domain